MLEKHDAERMEADAGDENGAAAAVADLQAINLTAPAGNSSVTDKVQEVLLRKLLEQCVDNWKAASAELKKKMWQMYEESGVFASACRHGLILWLCDMIRSGEL